jgi:hypothetical protein
MISQAELDRFYENLVSTVRANGGVCAITSGMACVKYGVAISTKDCDLLCSVETTSRLFDVLTTTTFAGASCAYRGHLTAPLDARWQRGGWTAHFQWKNEFLPAHLDVFGVAPRGSSPWEAEQQEALAGMHTVAEMKRTDRMKDWPFATALGMKLIEQGDERGWLHVFDARLLRDLKTRVPCPEEVIRQRPLLRLLMADDPRLDAAVFGEIVFWQQLGRLRFQIHESVVRPYFMAVKKDRAANDLDLTVQHAIRVQHAETLLPQNPMRDYGLDRMVAEAREAALRLVAPGALDWLPDVSANFATLLS